jgi:hypothetical protein
MLQTEAYLYDRKLQLQTFIVQATNVFELYLGVGFHSSVRIFQEAALKSFQDFVFCVQLSSMLSKLVFFH